MRTIGVFLLCISAPVIATEDCKNANTTYEIGACMSEQLEQQEVEMQHYLAESRARYTKLAQLSTGTMRFNL
jgi:uncharacterized protein